MIKSWKMRWAGTVARMGAEECVFDFDGKVRRNETTRKTYVSGRIIRTKMDHRERGWWGMD
jgi:hypothetical protein